MATGGRATEFVEGMRVDAGFDIFVEARSTALLRTAYLLTGHRAEAEDLVQTALLRTARHWSTAREQPNAYTRQVLVNLSHDRLRRLRRRLRESPLPETEVGGSHLGFDHEIAERHSVAAALRHLPIRQRQVVVLRFFDDLSVAQTATLMGCSEGAVKSHTARALERLRGLLADSLTDPLEESSDAHR
jgi:RNA polymerase sigma-70 factor (sigma-E family)